MTTFSSRENPILAEFRRSCPWDLADAARTEVPWLSGPSPAPIPRNATRDQIIHARKVLERIGFFGARDDS